MQLKDSHAQPPMRQGLRLNFSVCTTAIFAGGKYMYSTCTQFQKRDKVRHIHVEYISVSMMMVCIAAYLLFL